MVALTQKGFARGIAPTNRYVLMALTHWLGWTICTYGWIWWWQIIR